MPRSVFQTFTDPDDYASAIRATKAELTITGRGQFSAKLVRLDLHRLWMRWFFDNLPRIMPAADATGRAIISFRTQSGPGLFWGGAEISIMVVCLGSGDVRERSAGHRRRHAIVRRFHAALEESRGRALYLPELCAVVGVSQRTLRRCCYDQFGISPTRFLLLRRMHMARRALREAAASSASEIAMQFGFWHLSRFDGVYRFLFGEPPSSTLSRPPDYRRESVVGFARIFEETA